MSSVIPSRVANSSKSVNMAPVLQPAIYEALLALRNELASCENRVSFNSFVGD